MQYSLLNRFRGAFLGSLVGEILGSDGGLRQVLDRAALIPPKIDNEKPSQTLSAWSQIAACGTESLIRCGRLNLEDWMLYCDMTQPSLLLLKTSASISEAAMMMLPLALFFHEDEVKLRQQLLQAVGVWQQDSQAFEGVLAVSYAIALALTEKLDAATLIPQILAYLEPSQSPLVQQLEQVQTLLEQGAGLDRVLAQLYRQTQARGNVSDRPYASIALAFYCFLSTPEDFRLCVTRAARTGHQFQLAAALTGALAGVYNSVIGIPTGWRLAANRMSTGVERLQQADRLLAVWSGVYDVSTVDRSPWAAVAAPRVIQPR